MRRLLVIRHAKSDWDSSAIADFERPLNKRGLSDAPKMGIHLKEMALFPDLIISSGAKRAITTAKLIAKSLDYTNDILVDNNIYNASSDDIKSIINKIDEKYNTVFLFGHNPGLTSLVSYLTDDWMELKTCCVAILESEIDSWENWIKGVATIKEYISPKSI